MTKNEALAGAILLTLFAAKPMAIEDEKLTESIQKSGAAPTDPWDLHAVVEDSNLLSEQKIARIDGTYWITDTGVAWLREQELI